MPPCRHGVDNIGAPSHGEVAVIDGEALYHAVYHDGDEEDLDVHELMELLVPRDGDDKMLLASREKDLEFHASAWKASRCHSVPTSVSAAGSVRGGVVRGVG